VLTKPLIRARVRKDRIHPQLVDPDDPRCLDLATVVLDTYRDVIGADGTRGELDEQLDELCSERRDHRLARGLAKVCADRSTFDSEAPVDPVQFRREVFLAARQAGPLALERGKLERPVAADVLQAAGAPHGLTVEQARSALYADLRENQRLLRIDIGDHVELLRRYNVSLVQSILLRAEGVVVDLHDAPTPRVRQLLRWVRFHQLIATVEDHPDTLRLSIDGPMSLFRQSTRYGKNLASFLPALLLQDRWELKATVRWGRRKVVKRLVLTSDDGLVSFRRDTGAYKTREQVYFEERFSEHDTDWQLEEGQTVIPLGARRVAVPDYTLRRGGDTVHLQLVGFWRRETLDDHLAQVAAHAPSDLIVAVSKRLAGDKAAELPEQVVAYASVLSPSKVVAAADTVCAQRKR